MGSGGAHLPQELARPQERCWVLKFPTHDVIPLVELQRQVAVGPDPAGESGIHDGLTGGTWQHGIGTGSARDRHGIGTGSARDLAGGSQTAGIAEKIPREKERWRREREIKAL